MYAGKHLLCNIALQQIIELRLCAKDSTGESGGKQSFYFLGSCIRIQVKHLLEVISERSLKSYCFKEQQQIQTSTKFDTIF